MTEIYLVSVMYFYAWTDDYGENESNWFTLKAFSSRDKAEEFARWCSDEANKDKLLDMIDDDDVVDVAGHYNSIQTIELD